MKVLFVITGVMVGGAETMLLKLASGLGASFEPRVVSLEPAVGGLSDRYREAGVPLQSLNMAGASSLPAGVGRLVTTIRRYRPDVVCTWLYHADLVGALACRLAGHRALAWNIRNSDLDPTRTPRAQRAIVSVNAKLSRLPRQILCCSENARQIHVDLGYSPTRFRLIPNGFDLDAFRPDPSARQSVRREFGIPDEAPLVGMVARFNPQKDHRTFIAAAAQLRRSLPSARFLLIGKGCTDDNAELRRWIDADDLSTAFHLAGPRSDINRLTAALDIATLTSIYGEAFPNVLGEAMACGVPCVTTPVGDSAAIVGETGLVVRPGDPSSVAAGWLDLLTRSEADRSLLGERARQRVQTEYDIREVRRRYEQAFSDLAAG